MSKEECDFGAESLGPEEHMRCLKEQHDFDEKRKLVEWARRNVIMAHVEDHAKTLIQNVLADLVEYDMIQHPNSTMEDRVNGCAKWLHNALYITCKNRG